MPYPVTYSIRQPERYNKWMVGFRIIVGMPLILLLTSLPRVRGVPSGGGGALAALLVALAVYAWFAILFTGAFPTSMRATVTFLFRWSLNISAYLALLADQYPPFSDGPYPLEITVEPAEQYNRWTVGFRLILVIPHLIVLFFLGIAAAVVTVIAWFAILFSGQYPAGMYEFSVGVARWSARVSAYLYLLVDEYPPFSLEEDAGAALQPQTA